MVKLTKAQRAAIARLYARMVETALSNAKYEIGEMMREHHASFPAVNKALKSEVLNMARDAYAKAHAFPSYRAFRKTAMIMIMGNGAIVIPWQGMMIAIETDGHSHS